MNEIDSEIPKAEFFIKCFFSQSSGICLPILNGFNANCNASVQLALNPLKIGRPGEARKLFMIQMKIIWTLIYVSK